MPIDPMTTPLPSSTDTVNFDTRADLAWEEFADRILQINALAADLNDLVSAAFTTTSSTSMAVSAGAKSITVETNLAYGPSQNVLVGRIADPSTFVVGRVDDYDRTTGVLNFTVPSGGVSGSGTFTDWAVSMVPAGDISAFMASLLSSADAETARATLGVESLIASGTFSASGAPIIALPAGYKNYRVELFGVTASAGCTISGTFSFDGGANYKVGASDYSYSYLQQSGSAAVGVNNSGNSLIQIVPTAMGTSLVLGANIGLSVRNPTGTGATAASFKWDSYVYTGGAANINLQGAGSVAAAYGNVDHVKFTASSGTITGNYAVYGIPDA